MHRCKLSFAKSRSRGRPCLRRSGYAQAGEILRCEAYLDVRRNKPAPCLTRGRMSLPAGRQGKRSRCLPAAGRGVFQQPVIV